MDIFFNIYQKYLFIPFYFLTKILIKINNVFSEEIMKIYDNYDYDDSCIDSCVD